MSYDVLEVDFSRVYFFLSWSVIMIEDRIQSESNNFNLYFGVLVISIENVGYFRKKSAYFIENPRISWQITFYGTNIYGRLPKLI